MSSILKTPFKNELIGPSTISLEERPFTEPLHLSPRIYDRSWEARVNAECDRTPTVELGVFNNAQAASAAVKDVEAICEAGSTPISDSSLNETVVQTATATENAVTTPELVHGRYQLEQPIAIGGTAIIYKARDLQRHETIGASEIVVKLLKPEFRSDARAIERLKREYAFTLKLKHPDIVRVFDLDRCERHGWFMTMEFVEGKSLAALMRQTDKPMPKQRRLSIIQACARALSFAHTHGVMHCDFKPSNVMITPAGRVRLLDFGAACALNEDSKQLKAAAATPAYASPQIMSGKPVDARDDLFSLACVAYELLTGRHPFGLTNAMHVHRDEQFLVRPTQLSHTQWQALQRALNREREQRQESVAAFLKDFTKPPKSPAWWLTAGGVALIAFGLLLAGNHFSKTQRSNTASPPTIQNPAAVGSATSSAAASSLLNANSARHEQLTLTPTLSTTLQPSLDASATTLKPKASSTANDKPHPRQPAPTVNNNSSSLVAFERKQVTVSDLAIAAALIITRTDARDDERIEWRTVDGTAHAGIDYDPTFATAVFRKGQTRRTIYVNLKNNSAASGDRSFAVELTNGSSKVISRVEVTIKHSSLQG